jgi:hypothetical protein
MDGRRATRRLPELSNFCCLPGRAGGSPLGISNSDAWERAASTKRKFDMDNFDQTKAKVNRAIKRALGDRLATPYLIVKLDPIAGSRIHRFGLSLPPETITIARTSLRPPFAE